MRLFLAIFPPKEYLDYFRDTLRKFNKEKRNLKYIPVDQMHLTIRFIGPRVSFESKQALVEEFMKHEGHFGNVELEVTGVKLGFPFQGIKQKRILIAKLKHNDTLQNCTKATHRIIKELKFEDTIYWKAKYAENYHLSLARLKPSATHKSAKEVIKITEGLQKPKLEPFIAKEMYFVESIIQNDLSPVYKKLEKITL